MRAARCTANCVLVPRPAHTALAARTERGVSCYAGWELPGSSHRFFARPLKWGEVGCALSHHGIWASIVEILNSHRNHFQENALLGNGLPTIIRRGAPFFHPFLATHPTLPNPSASVGRGGDKGVRVRV